MDLLEIVIVPVIVGIVYGILELYKLIVKSETGLKIIPIIAAVLGAAFGVVAFYAAPGLVPAENVLTAILIGGASGLAATGSHQIFKQLNK